MTNKVINNNDNMKNNNNSGPTYPHRFVFIFNIWQNKISMTN